MIRHAETEQRELPKDQKQEDQQRQDPEQEEAEERSAPTGKVVYKAILKEGEDELERSSSALFYSGLAAGLSMGFCLITEGVLKAHLPDARWAVLITKFGYCIGFLIVILGRQQLFTENTLTPILPLLQKPSMKSFGNVMRLWGIVLVANLLGSLVLAWVVSRTPVFSQEVRNAFASMAHETLAHGFWLTMLKGIFAGWLIALLVWLLPFAETARVAVIVIITYVVGIGQFSHIIAGATETFGLAWVGQKSWGTVLGSWILPTLIGNIVGGVTLVTALNHAQVVAGSGGSDV